MPMKISYKRFSRRLLWGLYGFIFLARISSADPPRPLTGSANLSRQSVCRANGVIDPQAASLCTQQLMNWIGKGLEKAATCYNPFIYLPANKELKNWCDNKSEMTCADTIAKTLWDGTARMYFELGKSGVQTTKWLFGPQGGFKGVNQAIGQVQNWISNPNNWQQAAKTLTEMAWTYSTCQQWRGDQCVKPASSCTTCDQKAQAVCTVIGFAGAFVVNDIVLAILSGGITWVGHTSGLSGKILQSLDFAARTAGKLPYARQLAQGGQRVAGKLAAAGEAVANVPGVKHVAEGYGNYRSNIVEPSAKAVLSKAGMAMPATEAGALAGAASRKPVARPTGSASAVSSASSKSATSSAASAITPKKFIVTKEVVIPGTKILGHPEVNKGWILSANADRASAALNRLIAESEGLGRPLTIRVRSGISGIHGEDMSADISPELLKRLEQRLAERPDLYNKVVDRMKQPCSKTCVQAPPPLPDIIIPESGGLHRGP